jgi:phage minor structural protein
MIQIYKPTNENYESNGDIVLMPETFTVSAELNGAWSTEMVHPIDDDGRWKYIEDQAVVKAPSFNGEQLFRITSKSKSDSGVIASMEPIFFDSMNDCFLVDVRPTDKTGQQALDIMTAPNSKYSGESDIDKLSTAYYQFKNLMEAINGDDDNSFIKRWGGEILFDNFKVIINERVGGDYGVELRYGKNIPVNGMTEEIDMTSVTTRIYPKAYNGYTMTNNGYVDSPLINNYPTVKARTITFDDVKMREDAMEDDEENGIIVCDTQAELNTALTQKCNDQYASGVDKPKVTINADMVLLANTEQYKEFKTLEEVSLGDTIHCINNHLGITTDARVITITYDSILKKVDSVTIGDYEYNYFNNVTSSANRIESAVRPDGTVVAEQVKGFIDGAWSQLRLQNTVAKKQDVRAILFEDLDPTSETFGAMALGTQGLQISRNRTADGKDWLWTTALTAKGLIANIIVAGIISSSDGSSSWNLDTGAFISNSGVDYRGDIEMDKGILRSSRETSLGTASFELLTDRLQFIDYGGTDYEMSMSYRADGFQLSGASGRCSLMPGPDGMELKMGEVEFLPVQKGKFSTNVPANSYADYYVKFNKSFENAPTMIAAFESTSVASAFGQATIATHDVTAIGGYVRIFNNDDTGREPYINWIAVGK